MNKYELEHVLTLTAYFGGTEVIGVVPGGLQMIAYFTGGEVTGPKVQGSLHAVGGDWFTIRQDGVGLVDVRTTIETHDGALIYVHYTGVADMGADAYNQALQGQLPPVIETRTSVHMQTGHPDYAWVNRVLGVGIGYAPMAEGKVTYDIYALR